MKTIDVNDLVLIMHKDMRYLKRMTMDGSFHGKGGQIRYSELIGRPFGIRCGEYDLFEPTVEDIIMYGIKRETQIVFPKDGSFICFKLNLQHGSRIIEVGTGSGVMTFLFSRMVGPQGHVVSFEREERHHRNAKKNMERFTEWGNVELRHGDVVECADGDFDAAFIDVREPGEVLDLVRPLMKASAPIGMIVPTANQISDVLKVIPAGFGDIEVIELMLRKYKTVAERVRPFDRMVAHTGYLIFARKLETECPIGISV
jgi:tRNA (adenine57-N1/adenine58-N1)-methyltransferase catalytic subunit